MKYFTAILVASAALTSAQVVYNETTGTFICPASAPNGAFCAGTSEETNIIIRCKNGVGQPGNCNDNLAGRPPTGVRYSPCFASAPDAGDAACSRNCIVYPENGSQPFVIPKCSPIYTSTTTTFSTSTISHNSTSTTHAPPPPPPTTTVYPNTTTIVPPPPPHPPITTLLPTGSGVPHPPTNGTTTTQATHTPIGPTATTSQPPQFTGAADKNSVGALAGALAFAALFIM